MSELANETEATGFISLDPEIEELFAAAGIDFFASIGQKTSEAELNLNNQIGQIDKDRREATTAYLDFERFRMTIANSAAMAIFNCNSHNHSAINSQFENNFSLDGSRNKDEHDHDNHTDKHDKHEDDDEEESGSLWSKKHTKAARSILGLFKIR